LKLTNLILSNDEDTGKRILILSGIAWLPLVVLTLIDGTFISDDVTIPFVKDVIPYVRGLIAIPLLVMADNIIEPMMSRTLKYLRTSGVVPEAEHARLDEATDKMTYLINTKWIQMVLVILVVLVSWVLRADYVDMWTESDVTSWALHLENGEIDETMAGIWFLLVTSPMVSFLLYRWVWRFIAWSILLYRVSRMELELYASHTDLAGGLGVIGSGQVLFGIVFLILASLVSSELASNILYEGDNLVNVKQLALVYIFIAIIVIALPLLFFTEKLFALKRKALVEYGALQQQISRDFHHHWISDESRKLVDSMQPSAIADYSAVYEIVSNMRIVPINPKAMIILAALLLLPFLPLVLTEQSIWDVLKTIGDSVL
jgi:hypothetical protein